jgi:hypothetical protein
MLKPTGSLPPRSTSLRLSGQKPFRTLSKPIRKRGAKHSQYRKLLVITNEQLIIINGKSLLTNHQSTTHQLQSPALQVFFHASVWDEFILKEVSKHKIKKFVAR